MKNSLRIIGSPFYCDCLQWRLSDECSLCIQTSDLWVTLRLAAYRQSVRPDDKPLETHDQNFYFITEHCGYSPYVTSFLTRGWVCPLQLLLVLARTVIFRSESQRTHGHILLFQTGDSPTWRPRFPYLYPQEQGDPVILPGTGFPFRRLLRTFRATVEVFDPASTR
jgi:hypothetical protein